MRALALTTGTLAVIVLHPIMGLATGLALLGFELGAKLAAWREPA